MLCSFVSFLQFTTPKFGSIYLSNQNHADFNISFLFSPPFFLGSITYTEFLNGYVGTKQYANFDAANVNFMKCRRLCNSDPICNGFIYNSATGQCRHVDSSSFVPFSDNKFSFYRKDCPLGKSLLVQT